MAALLMGTLSWVANGFEPTVSERSRAAMSGTVAASPAAEFMDWPLPATPAEAVAPIQLAAVPADPDTKGVEPMCRRIGNKLGSVGTNECLAMHLMVSRGRSVNGDPILVREYAPRPERTPLGRVLLIGGMHGDEYSSVSILFKWMGILNEHHSGLFHWIAIPLLNPDGLLREHSQRQNQHGVDLNRNFPTPRWHERSHRYWIEDTGRSPRRYPGPDPLSEPESRWLAEVIQRFRPDAIVSVHAPYGVLDFDGPPKAPERLGHLYLNLLGTYPGSLGNYAGVRKRIPVVTIELPHAGIMPSDEHINEIWVDLVKWLRSKLEPPTLQVKTEDQAEPS